MNKIKNIRINKSHGLQKRNAIRQAIKKVVFLSYFITNVIIDKLKYD
jgi:hypothetical protein